MLLNLPTDLLNVLTGPESIGKSGVFAIRYTCHFLREIINPAGSLRDACAEAAANGHHKFIEWAMEFERDVGIFTCAELAAANGHVETLDCLYKHGLVDHQHPIAVEAARGGHIDVLKYIRQRFFGFMRVDHVIETSAHAGHLHVMQWLYDEYPHWFLGYDIMLKAVSGGQLEVIKWYTGMPGVRQFNSADMLTAVCHGHVPVVEWAVDGGWVIGRVDAIGYANHAASRGCLDMLKWMIANRNLELSADMFDRALMRLSPNNAGGRAVVDWLHEQNCPSDVRITDDIVISACHRIYILQWLVDHGYPLSPKAAVFYNTYK